MLNTRQWTSLRVLNTTYVYVGRKNAALEINPDRHNRYHHHHYHHYHHQHHHLHHYHYHHQHHHYNRHHHLHHHHQYYHNHYYHHHQFIDKHQFIDNLIQNSQTLSGAKDIDHTGPSWASTFSRSVPDVTSKIWSLPAYRDEGDILITSYKLKIIFKK